MKYELQYTSLSDFNLDYYMDDVAYYFDSFFKHRYKRFLNSSLFTRWCHKLSHLESKETAQIIQRAFYLYRVYERIQNQK